MSKFVESINVFRNVRQYLIVKKIEGYASNKDQGSGFGVEGLSIVLFLALMISGYILIRPNFPYYWFLPGILVIFFYFLWVSAYVKKYNIAYSGIQKLILKDEEGRNIKEWYVEGKKSLLIGRKTQDNEVDIDLSDSEYVTLISKQHAVLNLSENIWYIEDIGSSNGTSLKKLNEGKKVKLEQGTLYKINSGDTIYIANTRIVIK